jgi:alpha-glucosidase
MRYVGAEDDDLREVLVFPYKIAGIGFGHTIEDDGVSLPHVYTYVDLRLICQPDSLTLEVSITGDYPLPYDHVDIRLPQGETRPLDVPDYPTEKIGSGQYKVYLK